VSFDGPRHLFVYGTLMSSAEGTLGAAERRRLQSAATAVSPATVNGLLYDLGGYPGLVLTDEAGPLVHGELVELNDPAAAFSWLDPYEDVSPVAQPSDLYRRVATTAVTAAGERVSCWVYEMHGSMHGHAIPPGGRWLGSGR